jgi:hypothetical protein
MLVYFFFKQISTLLFLEKPENQQLRAINMPNRIYRNAMRHREIRRQRVLSMLNATRASLTNIPEETESSQPPQSPVPEETPSTSESPGSTPPLPPVGLFLDLTNGEETLEIRQRETVENPQSPRPENTQEEDRQEQEPGTTTTEIRRTPPPLSPVSIRAWNSFSNEQKFHLVLCDIFNHRDIVNRIIGECDFSADRYLNSDLLTLLRIKRVV